MLNKKMLLSVLIVGMVASVAGAGTWAAFSDTETSTGNTFTAGTLDLTLSDPATTGVNVANVYPGAAGTQAWTLKNAGNINGKMKIDFNVHNAVDGTPTTVTPGNDNDLNSAINVNVLVNGESKYTGTLAGLTTISDIDMNFGDDSVVTIEWNIPAAIDNGIQGDSTSFDVTFTLEQA